MIPKGRYKFFCAFLMLFLVLSNLAMTKHVVFANGNTPNVTKIRIGNDDSGKFLSSEFPYLVGGEPSADPSGATASLINNELTLNNYNDK